MVEEQTLEEFKAEYYSHNMTEKTKMNLREQAQAFEPTARTQNIADLPEVDIDQVELKNGSGTNKETGEVFTYKYIVIEKIEYRVPLPVLGQLKTHLENNLNLKKFKVIKAGTGKATQYTVVPVGA